MGHWKPHREFSRCVCACAGSPKVSTSRQKPRARRPSVGVGRQRGNDGKARVRHSCVAGRGVAVRRGSIFVMLEGKRPHPRFIYLEDAAHHEAIRGATAGGWLKMSDEPLARNSQPIRESRRRSSRNELSFEVHRDSFTHWNRANGNSASVM